MTQKLQPLTYLTDDDAIDLLDEVILDRIAATNLYRATLSHIKKARRIWNKKKRDSTIREYRLIANRQVAIIRAITNRLIFVARLLDYNLVYKQLYDHCSESIPYMGRW